MRVHRKDRLLAGKQQHAPRGFRADAFERGEKGEGFCGWLVAQESQVQCAGAGLDFVENVFDDDGFDVRQTAALDRGGNRRGTRAAHVFPGGKAFFQSGKRARAVHVRSGLRKDRGNQFVERIKVRVRRGRAIRGFEVLGDIADWRLEIGDLKSTPIVRPSAA